MTADDWGTDAENPGGHEEATGSAPQPSPEELGLKPPPPPSPDDGPQHPVNPDTLEDEGHPTAPEE